jgi:hypothetical protein
MITGISECAEEILQLAITEEKPRREETPSGASVES